MSPLLRRLTLVPAVGALLAAGCQDFPGQFDPGRGKSATTGTTPAATKAVTRTGTVGWPRATTAGTYIVTRTVRMTVTNTAGIYAPASAVDARNGVPILEAILANPIKADNEFRNRTVRLQGLGTVGRDAKGYFITFPTTAVAPGEVKPQPGIVARIAPGEEAAFADLKRDATVTIMATVRSWRTDVPDTYRGVVIEMDQARLIAVAHAGY